MSGVRGIACLYLSISLSLSFSRRFSEPPPAAEVSAPANFSRYSRISRGGKFPFSPVIFRRENPPRFAVAHATPTFDTLTSRCARPSVGRGVKGKGISVGNSTRVRKSCEKKNAVKEKFVAREGGFCFRVAFYKFSTMCPRGEGGGRRGEELPSPPSLSRAFLASTNSGISTCLRRYASSRRRSFGTSVSSSASFPRATAARLTFLDLPEYVLMRAWPFGENCSRLVSFLGFTEKREEKRPRNRAKTRVFFSR